MQAHKYLSEGKTAHKEANISGWIIVPTPTQLSTQHSPSRTSNTSNQSIRTPSTCAANFSEKKMVLTYSVLAQLSQQNFLHFNPTDRHTSTCASNIQHPQNFQNFNPTDRQAHKYLCGQQVHKYLCIHHPQNFQHFNPTDRQVHKSLCIQHPQNFQHFNPTDRYTSTCASNFRRTSSTSTQPIGRHRSTRVANLSERWYSILCVAQLFHPAAEL